jgi:hypothetical protein
VSFGTVWLSGVKTETTDHHAEESPKVSPWKTNEPSTSVIESFYLLAIPGTRMIATIGKFEREISIWS